MVSAGWSWFVTAAFCEEEQVNVELGLAGKTVWVCGAAGGLGRAIALAFATEGATLALSDRDEDRLAAFCDRLQQQGTRAEPFPLDVTKQVMVEQVSDQVVAWAGRVDVLVNAAGINIRKPLLDYDPEEFERVLEVNLLGVYYPSRAAARHMIDRGGGAIVSVASTLATISQIHLGPYAASKGGILQLTKVMAEEWAPLGIRVNAVGPGYVETELTEKFLSDPDTRSMLLSKIPFGRFGKPEEIADAVVYLASDRASYITGQILYVDGGRVVV
jgi:gluconate 5-dehydrogenase